MIEIKDFVHHSPVEPEVIAAYRDRVPAQLVEIWEHYGYGSFADGFLRVINPAVYEAEVGDCIGKTEGDGVAIPVMVTGLGDLITWEPSMDALTAIMYRNEEVDGLGTLSTVVMFANRGGIIEDLEAELYSEAVAAQGELPFEESFIFVPLLSLGGTEAVANLHKRETKAAIRVAVEFQGLIEH